MFQQDPWIDHGADLDELLEIPINDRPGERAVVVRVECHEHSQILGLRKDLNQVGQGTRLKKLIVPQDPAVLAPGLPNAMLDVAVWSNVGFLTIVSERAEGSLKRAY